MPASGNEFMTDAGISNSWRSLLLRFVVTAAVLALWFWTQSLLGARAAPNGRINDGLHNLTAGLNACFARNVAASNALLVVSSALIDGLGLFLLARWLFGRSVRPFLGLVLLMLLRQLLQALCSLPSPPNMIWHYPGFPSLLVTYNVANDFFFSGHTAIAVFGALELARFRKKWLTLAATLIVVFEIATVLILRAHYTMDVFAGLLAALWVAHLMDRIAPPIDHILRSTG
jgi:PAP2 superfamily C-terminal